MRKKKWYKSGCFIGFAGFMICISLLCSAVFGWHLYTQHRMHKAELLIAGYLKDKYHEDFIVLDGKYIWATGNYSFTAAPKNDTDLKFSVLTSGIYASGIGDMYKQLKGCRETKDFIRPFINSISRNNYLIANYSTGGNESILSDIHSNDLSLEQILKKYSHKLTINIYCYYALDITSENKDEVFEKVYKLINLLKKYNLGNYRISIYFFPTSTVNGMKIINHSYRTSDIKSMINVEYVISIEKKNHSLSTWEDIEKYFEKFNPKLKKWEKVNSK